MSEAREECYKCLNNKQCIPGADYNSIYCTAHRKYKMQEQDKDKIKELKDRIDKLIAEMRENGSQYWAKRLEKLKEEK